MKITILIGLQKYIINLYHYFCTILPRRFCNLASLKIALVAGKDCVIGFGAKKETGVSPGGIIASAVAWFLEGACALSSVEMNMPPPTIIRIKKINLLSTTKC